MTAIECVLELNGSRCLLFFSRTAPCSATVRAVAMCCGVAA
jgi:hypothetical protein